MFFDLGETIINIHDTVGVLASFVSVSYPQLALRSADLAKSWFLELAKSVPREPGSTFETQYDAGRRLLADLLRRNGVRVDAASAGRLLKDAWVRWQDGARLCEGVTKEWLRDVKGLSAGVGAVTDGDETDVRGLLAKMSLSHYFDSVTTSEAVKAYKPNPVIYRAALASLGAEPKGSVFVSDSTIDIEGALAVGMAAAWMHTRPSALPTNLPAEALRLSHPKELNQLLSRFSVTKQFEMP